MLFTLCVILSLMLMVSCNHEDSETSFKQMVTTNLGALKDKVAGLENKLVKMEYENMMLYNQLKHHRRETTFYPENEVAFSASVSQHIKNLVAHQTIVFGTTLTNIGNHYNSSTGVFYVPVSGTYQLFVNILSEADNNIETELLVNGQMVAEIYSGATRFHGAGSNLVIIRLKQGDTVWVKVHAAYSSDMAVHCCWSTFSGLLLREVSPPNQIVG